MLRAANYLVVLFVFLLAVKQFLVPPLATYFYGPEYKRLMFQCDQVMRDHYIAKKLVETAPSDSAIRNLESAEKGLLSCHDYDKLRKTMLDLGVSDARVGLLGLEALEEKADDVKRFVEVHEIRY